MKSVGSWLTNYRLILWVLFCVVFATGATQADEVNVYTAKSSIFVYENEQKQLDGYTIELLRGIQKQAGNTQPIQVVPWARLFNKAKHQPNTLVTSLARTPQREHQFYWITPVTENLYGIFGRGTTLSAVSDPVQLAGVGNIGVLRGDFREKVMLDAGLTNIRTFKSWEQVLSALQTQRIDYFFYSANGLALWCSQALIKCQDFRLVYKYRSTQTYIAMSKQTDPAIVENWQVSAERFKQSHDFALLVDKWQHSYKTSYGLSTSINNGVMNLR